MVDESGSERPGIDIDLNMIADETRALRELASDPDRAQDNVQVYNFSIIWGALMAGRLERLEHYYQSGELTEDQERRYRDLRRQLKDAMPLIERLDVRRPRVPLED